ncbi:hypothetical protein IFM89_014570 [Coptis chinensis]|uniref:TCP domain-containing protein n=1 Tax=Coptis chinensis TaxID=261450 RepID=A0A835GXH8_9MAGN|nr:hypothetical protein IFM89_014570 [Coptis chinensis]
MLVVEVVVVVVRNQKLEEEKKKGLSLDPQRNQNHHPHHHHYFQSHLHLHQEQEQEQEDQEEEEEEEQQQQPQEVEQQHGFYGLPQSFHQQVQQHQLFYGREVEGSSLEAQPPKKRSYFPLSEEQRRSIEYARFGEKMGDNPQQPQQTTSRLGLLKSSVGGGEIVEVQGGHIVRSTGRKDRHSKVCTAKGPRDRRVRLSAHTAIQFYDVQDRLGYDRPSKAVDWLIKKAKSAIDELAELPPWRPSATTPTSTAAQSSEQGQEEENQNQGDGFAGSSKRPLGVEQDGSGYGFQQQHLSNNPTSSSGFLPPSLDSDAIADTIKSFFPIAASTTSPPIHFQNYPPDLLSRTTSSHTQDLRLSLQSFQDPILLHHQSQHQHSNPNSSVQQTLFSNSSPLPFETNSTSWSDQQHQEIGRFQRMVAWNAGTDAGSGVGFVFNSQQPSQPVLGQNPFFTQRGPLQSSNSPQFRAWTDPSIANSNQMQSVNQSLISGIGFASGGFSGFRIPARIQGEEEHDAASNKPPSASRH